MTKEIFKSIQGYEGLYEVSNFGKVKSIGRYDFRGHFRKEKILKPSKKKDGYYAVILYKDGKTKMFRIHRLVAKAFIHNPNNYPQVNHKDKIRTNNNVDNLEWCDNKYNTTFSLGKKVKCLDLVTNKETHYVSINEAARQLGINNHGKPIWQSIHLSNKPYKNRYIFTEE